MPMHYDPIGIIKFTARYYNVALRGPNLRRRNLSRPLAERMDEHCFHKIMGEKVSCTLFSLLL